MTTGSKPIMLASDLAKRGIDRLAEPFREDEIKWKPQTVTKDGNTCLAVPYVDARVIQDRLDDVMGIKGWMDSYAPADDGSHGVKCRLSLFLDGEWITKEDVGSPSEQPDAGDRTKSAYSDALKRAAIKFGIGRYLYQIEQKWVAFDSQKRKIIQVPTLPAWARPGGRVRKEIRNGAELKARVVLQDALLAEQGVLEPGELVGAVLAAGKKAQLPEDMGLWHDKDQISLAQAAGARFIREARARREDEAQQKAEAAAIASEDGQHEEETE